MTIQKPPITEPIQPMPPAWAIWFQNLVTAVLGLLGIPAGRVPYGNGNGFSSDAAFTYDGTLKAPLAKFGSAANYTEFLADGTMRFVGDSTVWNDINISLVPPQGGATAPAIIAFNGDARLDCYAFSGTNTTPDEIHSSMETLHGYKEGTDIRFHLHWYPTNTTVANIKWQFRYTWFNRDNVPGAAQTMTITETTSGVAWQEKTSVFVVPGAGKTMGSRLVFSIFRDATDPADTYGFNAAVSDMGVHYEIDQVGSREVLVK